MQGKGAQECTAVCCGAKACESEHAKALAALTDGQFQHLVQLLIGIIHREAQLVETRQKEITGTRLRFGGGEWITTGS